ncbi:hypothetical protein PR048_025498 [Dryococelus australis]|uniref:Uncharacterized protein n=1 Tax=Dryococelus australis TaxID=614101 RepID=A0ABQ9GRH7_9NEOP|nr:hypothetical protein PR048_025498 [Dryococelus australis]
MRGDAVLTSGKEEFWSWKSIQLYHLINFEERSVECVSVDGDLSVVVRDWVESGKSCHESGYGREIIPCPVPLREVGFGVVEWNLESWRWIWSRPESWWSSQSHAVIQSWSNGAVELRSRGVMEPGSWIGVGAGVTAEVVVGVEAGVTAEVVVGVEAGVTAEVAVGVEAGVTAEVVVGVEAGVTAEVVVGVGAGVTAEVAVGVEAGVTAEVAVGVEAGVTAEVVVGVGAGVTAEVVVGVGAGVTAEVAVGVEAGVTAEVVVGVEAGVTAEVVVGVGAGVTAEVVVGVEAGVTAEVVVGVEAEVTAEEVVGVEAGVTAEVVVGVEAGVTAEVAVGVEAGVTAEVVVGVEAGVTAEVAVGVEAGVTAEVVVGVGAGVTAEVVVGVGAGVTAEVVVGVGAGVTAEVVVGVGAGVTAEVVVGVGAGVTAEVVVGVESLVDQLGDWKKLKSRVLTDDGEVDVEVAGGRVAEVNAAAVDALVGETQVVDEQLRRRRRRAEVGALAKRRWGRPQLRLAEVPAAHVEAGDTSQTSRLHCGGNSQTAQTSIGDLEGACASPRPGRKPRRGGGDPRRNSDSRGERALEGGGSLVPCLDGIVVVIVLPCGEVIPWASGYYQASALEIVRGTAELSYKWNWGSEYSSRSKLFTMDLTRYPGDLPPRETGSIPCRVTVVPDDAVGRRVFSGILRFAGPNHSDAAPYSRQSPSSALRTAMLRALPNLLIFHSLSCMSVASAERRGVPHRLPASLFLIWPAAMEHCHHPRCRVRVPAGQNKFHTEQLIRSADLPWYSRLVREAVGSNPGQGMGLSTMFNMPLCRRTMHICIIVKLIPYVSEHVRC